MEEPRELSIGIGGARAAFTMDHLGGRDHVVAQCLVNGLVYYEVPLPTVLMALSQESTGIFLDIGANTGLYSFLTVAANPSLRAVSFEPVPSVRLLMERNCEANPALAKRIEISPYALSNKSGKAIIYEHINPAGLVPTSSSLEQDASLGIASTQVEISMTTLDAWAELFRTRPEMQDRPSDARVDFVKVDVEGHERSMFEGATTVISKDRPFIVVELLGGADSGFFENFLTTFDYLDIALFPGEARRIPQVQFIQEAWNHVFCPAERAWAFACTCRRIGLPIG